MKRGKLERIERTMEAIVDLMPGPDDQPTFIEFRTILDVCDGGPGIGACTNRSARGEVMKVLDEVETALLSRDNGLLIRCQRVNDRLTTGPNAYFLKAGHKRRSRRLRKVDQVVRCSGVDHTFPVYAIVQHTVDEFAVAGDTTDLDFFRSGLPCAGHPAIGIVVAHENVPCLIFDAKLGKRQQIAKSHVNSSEQYRQDLLSTGNSQLLGGGKDLCSRLPKPAGDTT